MILAPLMAPIISLAMAVVRQDNALPANSLKTLGLGLLLALSCAAVMTWVIPLRSITREIAARLNPTLLDLGVAMISGVASSMPMPVRKSPAAWRAWPSPSRWFHRSPYRVSVSAGGNGPCSGIPSCCS